MEPQYSVLLYSKYSPNCKKILDLINGGTVDFTSTVRLQLLCVDNPKVRERVCKNNQIDVTIIPCILSIYANGGVEKYDGAYAFKWVENILESFTPPPPPVQQPEPKYVQRREPERETLHESLHEPEEYEPRQESRQELRQELRREPDSDLAVSTQPSYPREQKNRVPDRMKPINPEGKTSISDIPIDETDRHRNVKQPPRLQRGNDIIEDENLFQGEPVSHRRPVHNVIKDTSQKNQDDPHGTMARAKELAKGRDTIEHKISNPGERPVAPR